MLSNKKKISISQVPQIHICIKKCILKVMRLVNLLINNYSKINFNFDLYLYVLNIQNFKNILIITQNSLQIIKLL